MLILEIDYRESKILKLINHNIPIVCGDTIYGPIKISNTLSYYYKICNLPLGDFIIKTENSIYYLIERKCISDLSSSIIDGRFRNQKSRLIESNANVIYIIEGYIKSFKGSLPHLTLKSSIINLQLNYNFNVIRSESDQDTVDYLLLLYKKCLEKFNNNKKTEINKEINKEINTEINTEINAENNTEINAINIIDTTDISQINLKKKSNTLPLFVNQLTCINGVSNSIATTIYQKYKNYKELIDVYNTLSDSDSELLLSEMIISNDSNSKKRKIGKALSKKIYQSINT